MIINNKEYDSVVFYDKKTREVCALVSDEDMVIPENCEIAIFEDGTQPMFGNKDDTVILKGAFVEKGVI